MGDGRSAKALRAELEAARLTARRLAEDNGRLRAKLGQEGPAPGAPAERPEGEGERKAAGVYREGDPRRQLREELEAADDEVARLRIERSILEARARGPMGRLVGPSRGAGIRRALQATGGGLVGGTFMGWLTSNVELGIFGALLVGGGILLASTITKLPPNTDDPPPLRGPGL